MCVHCINGSSRLPSGIDYRSRPINEQTATAALLTAGRCGRIVLRGGGGDAKLAFGDGGWKSSVTEIESDPEGDLSDMVLLPKV